MGSRAATMVHEQPAKADGAVDVGGSSSLVFVFRVRARATGLVHSNSAAFPTWLDTLRQVAVPLSALAVWILVIPVV